MFDFEAKFADKVHCMGVFCNGGIRVGQNIVLFVLSYTQTIRGILKGKEEAKAE